MQKKKAASNPRADANTTKSVTSTTATFKQPASKVQPRAPSKARQLASISAANTRLNLDSMQSVEMASNKKRGRTITPASTVKPIKRAKMEKVINRPPDQTLDIYVFGSGGCGELGLGYKKRNGKPPHDVESPRLNDLLDAKTVGVVQVAVGGIHCVALTHDNRILSWGVNDNGALGRDTNSQADSVDEDASDYDDADLDPKESTPLAIPSNSFGKDIKFAQVVASDSASFALTSTGSVYGWGTFGGGDGIIGFSKAGTIAADAAEKLKKGSPKDVQRTPILIPELKNIKLLAAGSNHILALDHKGDVFTWGCGEQNQLGRRILQRTRALALVPSQFGLPKRRVKSIACGAYHSFAVDDQDRVFAWGLNNFGQTGISNGAGEANAIIPTPTIVQSLHPYKIKDMQGGNHHSVACTDDYKLLVWGRCGDSQPGIPIDKLPKSSLILNAQNKPQILSEPTVIPGISATMVSAGIDHSFAINREGEVYSWGFSADYRTGLGTDDTVEVPQRIETLEVAGKKITFAGCGGQFGILAGPFSDADKI